LFRIHLLLGEKTSSYYGPKTSRALQISRRIKEGLYCHSHGTLCRRKWGAFPKYGLPRPRVDRCTKEEVQECISCIMRSSYGRLTAIGRHISQTGLSHWYRYCTIVVVAVALWLNHDLGHGAQPPTRMQAIIGPRCQAC
jgi:hypothetical protein